uniref:CIP2A N-terminal domain-containing protein n=1 Tax=Graphocephala atropunctata TaxID=36148 RepID=A0A1B6KG02_9HEMI
MDMSQIMQELITSASEWEKQKNYEPLIKNLKELSATDDVSVFDTGKLETAELYILLHELLSCHPAESEVMAAVVGVVQVAVRNPSACQALAHTYHLLYPLTALLGGQLPVDRQLAILRIIQELSYEVEIHWQEAQLSKLIRILLDIISGDDSELIPVALGVLVNLCHKNKPVVYTLVNCVDIKAFIRKVLNLKREHVETSVQVCKLVMVLDNLSGSVPDAQILSFVQVSFLRVHKAFNSGNVSLMRHIVSFFRHAKRSDHGRKVLLTYPTYPEDTKNLINILMAKEVPNNWQCVQQLVDFLQQLVDLELPTIVPLMSRMVACVLPWVKVEGVAPGALELISAVLQQCRKSDDSVYRAVCSSIEKNLQMLVDMLHSGCRVDAVTNEGRLSLTSLLHLFREVTADPHLAGSLATNVDKEELKKLLLPLMTLSTHDGIHLFQQSVTTLYVEVLSFVSELSLDDKEWLFLYSDLLHKKQILQALAVALFSGPYQVKKQILFLAGTPSFSKDCLMMLSRCLTDLNQLFQFPLATTNPSSEKDTSFSQPQLDFSSSFTRTQKEGLDSLIEKLNDLYKKNKIENSAVVELYQYKLADTRRAERALQASLAAADHHHTQLSHRVAHLTAETTRLHQLLYAGHQTQQISQLELTELRQLLGVAQESANKSHIKFKQLKQDVHSKSMIIKDQSDEISRMKQKIEEQARKCEELTQRTTSLMEEREDQNITIQKMEEKIGNLQETVEEHIKCIQKLETEKTDLQTTNTKLEEKLEAREQDICGLKGQTKSLEDQLVDLERMRKIIFEITGGKKSNF